MPASFDSISSGGIPIILNPGLAFRKEDHPCTIYCLKALSDLYTGKFGQSLPKNVLDAGTGILSIASALLGLTLDDELVIDCFREMGCSRIEKR